MKKPLIIGVLLICSFGLLSAEDTPHRKKWEIGSDIGLGLANNMVGFTDILKKNILIDLDKLAPEMDDKGAMLNFDLFADAFFNLTIKERYFLSFYTGLEGGFSESFDKSFMELISRGNLNNHNSAGDALNISGAVFGEIGAGFSTRFEALNDKLKIGGSLAYYIPIIYMPPGKVTYDLNTDAGTLITASADIKVYTPIGFTGRGGTELGEPEIDVGKILQSGGVDFSLQAEYRLFTFLDLGMNFNHIPLVPATLKSGLAVGLDNFTIGSDNLLSNPTLDIPEIKLTYGPFSGANQKALRPMKLDIYADCRPFSNDLLLVRPNIGFTAIYPDPEEAHFNIGALVKTSLVKNIFNIYLAMGIDGGIWKNRIGLGLNFRAAEFLMEVSAQSQKFDKSFTSGLGVTLGTRFGW
ncbi:hypothetical protein FACS1894110_18580 [Spirochaetia bacterium]|nr:hypothetical protein FACS1894110_18580 [Spirochaetia bacterium]